MKPFEKIMVVLGVASILLMVVIPFIGSVGFTPDGGIFEPTGKRVKCEVIVKNPVWSDNYNIEYVNCVTEEALFCEFPLSFATLALFREADTVKVELSSLNANPISKTFTIDEGWTSGVTVQKNFNYCIPIENSIVTVRVFDDQNVITDTREVSV